MKDLTELVKELVFLLCEFNCFKTSATLCVLGYFFNEPASDMDMEMEEEEEGENGDNPMLVSILTELVSHYEYDTKDTSIRIEVTEMMKEKVCIDEMLEKTLKSMRERIVDDNILELAEEKKEAEKFKSMDDECLKPVKKNEDTPKVINDVDEFLRSLP